MGSSPNLSVTWTTSAYKSTYNCSTDDTNVWQSTNYSTDDTNVWQSQTTTIPMTPTCGSHEQLQYSGHQHVAVIDNYNTDDTNMWQSRITTILMTPTSVRHRQHMNEQLRNQWSKLCTIFTTWTNCSSRCTEPYNQYQNYHSPYQRVTGASNEAQESQLNQKTAVSLIHYWLLTWTPTT